MTTIEMTVIVDESRQLTLQLPDGILPGRHRVILAIDEPIDADVLRTTEEIDAAFAEMANDPEYQREALQLEEECAAAQWEALQVAETEA